MTLKDQYKKWQETTLKKTLDKYPQRKPRFETSAGIEIPALALPQDEDPDYAEKLGFPGEYPYTRGVQPGMYRSRFWTMRQYAGFSTAEESNKRYRYLLEHGQTGLSVAFDLPTQIGYDADDPIARGEVGKVGVSISSIHDMEKLFDQIPLDRVSTSMTINAPAGVLLAMYLAVAKRHNIEFKSLRGTIQNDISERICSPGYLYFSTRPVHAAHHRYLPFLPRGKCPTGTRSRSRGITSARQARPPCRKWLLPWLTGSLMWRRLSRPA